MSEPASASNQAVTAHQDAEYRHGLIAARIDRLPLGRTQFLLAAIMQITWGLVVALDLVFARIYPFIWQPKGAITSFEFDLMLVFNTGVGILIGEYGLGLIADKFGRRPVLVISALFAGGFIWEIAFSNSFWPLLAWNTLYAVGVGGALSVVNTYMHEIAPVSARGQLALRTQLIALLLSAVIGSAPAFFWIPQHYQWVLFLDAALPLLIVIPLVLVFVPESPRWLAAKGRFDQADQTVKRWEDKASRAGRLPEPQAVEAAVTEKVPLAAGPLFTATAASMNYGWFIWILLPGTFIPGVLIAVFGNRQSGRALELLAE